MIDSLEMIRPKIEVVQEFSKLGLTTGNYGVNTLHRPSNVDSPESLSSVCLKLIHASAKVPIVFPIHPRTRKNLKAFGLMDGLDGAKGIILTEPMSYIRFMNLVFNCRLVITDAGGLQEETTTLESPA